MKTILVTAYAVNPYKGSEEGTGWNLINQIGRNNQVIAITRKNNQEAIDKFYNENLDALKHTLTFLYFDLPKWMIKWKKGPLLSALYFYIWQIGVAIWVKNKKVNFDIAHSLNFHSNWTPSFLWILKKPFIWGPIGNHSKIPKQYILKTYGLKAYLKDRFLWIVKMCFWKLDPFLMICKSKAIKIFTVNSQTAKVLGISEDKIIYMPAVASESIKELNTIKNSNFSVLSVGRFVPLKGFDLTILSFSKFYKKLDKESQHKTNLLIIGTGPEKEKLQGLINTQNMQHAITIKDWMPRADVIEQFKHSSVFLFPSHEGAGMVVAEALSYAKPIICLDNYGPGEYVHPESELKVKQTNYEDTVNELSAKLKLLYSDAAFYNLESIKAIVQFNHNFKWDIKGDIMAEVYDKIALEVGDELSLKELV